jgi:hypothetical protein
MPKVEGPRRIPNHTTVAGSCTLLWIFPLAWRRNCSEQSIQASLTIIAYAVDEETRRAIDVASNTTHEIFSEACCVCHGLDIAENAFCIEA